MRGSRFLAAVSLCIGTLSMSSARAQEADRVADRPAAFQFSFWDSVQVIDRSRSIHGVRLTLPYGSNRDVIGVDIGIANHLTRNMYGLQLSLGGYVEGDFKGYQHDWILGIVEGDVAGVQGAIYSSAGSLKGLQYGLVNHVAGNTEGARLALVNVSEARTLGAELGIVNYAESVEGLQLGLVNVTEYLHGVQVGAVNVAKNGFLPVFVVFNAAL